MSYNMEFIADNVPAILVLGGILLAILGSTGSGSPLTLLGVVCIISGICIFLLQEKIIKV